MSLKIVSSLAKNICFHHSATPFPRSIMTCCGHSNVASCVGQPIRKLSGDRAEKTVAGRRSRVQRMRWPEQRLRLATQTDRLGSTKGRREVLGSNCA